MRYRLRGLENDLLLLCLRLLRFGNTDIRLIKYLQPIFIHLLSLFDPGRDFRTVNIGVRALTLILTIHNVLQLLHSCTLLRFYLHGCRTGEFVSNSEMTKPSQMGGDEALALSYDGSFSTSSFYLIYNLLSFD